MALSPSSNRELQETFNLFVTDESNLTIAVSSLGVIIRSLGLNPTDAELKAAADQHGGSDARISYEEFVKIFHSCSQSKLNTEDVVNAFRVFDPDNTGSINVTELRRVLTTLGEKLTVEEVDDFIADADPDGDGKINYLDLARRLLT